MCLCLSSLRPTVRPHLIPYRSMAHRPRRSPHSRRSPLTDSRHTASLLRPRTLMARPHQPTVSPRPTPTPTVNPHRRTAHRPPMAILTARFRRLTANTPRPLPLCRWISLTTDAPSKKPSCASGRSTWCSGAARPAVNSGGGCWPLSASISCWTSSTPPQMKSLASSPPFGVWRP